MGDKVKLDFTFEKAMVAFDLNGQMVEICTRLPFDERMDCIHEYAAMAVGIDSEKELAFRVYDVEDVKVYVFCKYYTNIDVEPYEWNMGALYDAIGDQYLDMVRFSDYDEVMHDAWNFVYRLVDHYNAEHSLEQKLKMSFRGVLNGEDIVKVISESRPVNEMMIDLLDKAKAHEEAESGGKVLFPWAAKKE